MSVYAIVPYQFWQTRRDKLAEVLVRKSLDACLCAELWHFLERKDDPPEIMDVLLITLWPEHPDDPELFVASRAVGSEGFIAPGNMTKGEMIDSLCDREEWLRAQIAYLKTKHPDDIEGLAEYEREQCALDWAITELMDHLLLCDARHDDFIAPRLHQAPARED